MNYKQYAKIGYGILAVAVYIALFTITKKLSHDIHRTVFDVLFLILIIYGLPLTPYLLLGFILRKDALINPSKIIIDCVVISLVSIIGIFVQFKLLEDRSTFVLMGFVFLAFFQLACIAVWHAIYLAKKDNKSKLAD